jgi:hypothetical protein
VLSATGFQSRRLSPRCAIAIDVDRNREAPFRPSLLSSVPGSNWKVKQPCSRHRLKRLAGRPPLLPAMRLAAYHGIGRSTRSHVRESRRHRFQRMVPPGDGAIRWPPSSVGVSSAGSPAVRRQSAHLKTQEDQMKPNTDVKMLSPSTKARASTVARSKD